MGRTLTAGAFATAAALALSLVVPPGTPAVAADPAAPREVTVIPPDAPTLLPLERLRFAGRTGFLHHHNASNDYLWTRYDTGATVVVKDLAGLRVVLTPAGGDTVSVQGTVPAHPTDGTINLLDLSDLSWEQWKLPTDGTRYGSYGREMLVGVGQQLELRTVGTEGTVVRTRPVTGLPDGERELNPSPLATDGESSVVVEVGTMRGYWYGVIDIATAKAVEIPGIDLDTLRTFSVSGDHVAWIDQDDRVHAYSRAGLLDGTNTTGRTAELSGVQSGVAFVGDRVLGVLAGTNGRAEAPAVLAPLGGSQHTVLPLAARPFESMVQGPDGTALLVGGTDWRDWSVRRFTPTGGEPNQVPVLPVRDPVETAALSYRHGVVRRVQSQVALGPTQYAVFHRNLAADDGSGGAAEAVYASGSLLADRAATCAPQVNCVRMLDPGYGGVRYVTLGSNGETTLWRQAGSKWATSIPTTNGRLIDADDRYAIVNGGTPASQYVVDTSYRKVVRTGPITGSALWYDTLWTATGQAGVFTRLALGEGASSTPLRTVTTGATCVATEVQVSTRWLYWSCGASGPAGAYDLTLNRSIALPDGPATLGDGFLVRHDAATGSLRMTDFHDGTVRPEVTLADLPAGPMADTRGHRWTVDRLGAGVAYADRDNAVHVLDTGVPATAPAVGLVTTTGPANPRTNSPWSGQLRFTRPVSSWRVSVTQKTTGRTFTLASGGPVRDGANVSWNGVIPGVGFAPNGGYRWTATGAVDGGTTVTLGSGSLVSTCGLFPFRTWDCYGGQALLGVTPAGDGKWYGEAPQTEPAGHLYNLGTQDYWCLSCSGAARTSALVPFGDFNGDGLPDLLVRDGDGGMRAYLGNGGNGFAPGVTRYLSMGRGWMLYRALPAPGDVTGDGRPDLLGVDKEGRLWLYALPGNGGVNPRVQVGSGWGGYPRVIGAGDLNGDGYGDLLGVDGSGVMYRYFSNGNKGWSSRVKVFAGWSIYNTIVPIGDLNQDGRHDLVARDADGILWFYAGLGNGSFATRVKAGAGWNMYKVIV